MRLFDAGQLSPCWRDAALSVYGLVSKANPRRSRRTLTLPTLLQPGLLLLAQLSHARCAGALQTRPMAIDFAHRRHIAMYPVSSWSASDQPWSGIDKYPWSSSGRTLFSPRTREKSVRERARRNACIIAVSSSVKKRRSDGFRTRSICSSYLGRFPNSKTLLSFFARARKHFSLSLVRKSTFARSTPCFAASLSFHVNQLAS